MDTARHSGGNDKEHNRRERVQAIKNRWFQEPLSVSFPFLGIATDDPATCADFVVSSRISFTGDTTDKEHFGVEDARDTLVALSIQFQTASNDQVNPKVLKDAAAVLSVFKSDSDALAARFASDSGHRDDMLHASYAADAKAATQCLTVITALANELGIALPIKGQDRRRS
jgi:hypothetical protein